MSDYRMYSTIINNMEVNSDSNDLSIYQRQYIRDQGLADRISELLIFEVFALEKAYGVHPHDVFGRILDLENDVVSGVKLATQLKNLPLKGLWHQHYFSPHFIVPNIRLGLGRSGVGKLIEEIFTRDNSPIVTQEMISEFSRRVVHDPLNARMEGNRATGEWIIYIVHNGSRYFLCASTHTAKDQSIYNKIVDHCLRDFPELIGWIEHARNSM